MSLVLDSSVALAWAHPDEMTKELGEIFERVSQTGAWVPSLWRLEVANVLEMGVRRGRYGADFVRATLADLACLPVRIDGETDDRAWNATHKLAAEHQLTLYDAAYLELAIRKATPLASLDKALREAARRRGVEVLGL